MVVLLGRLGLAVTAAPGTGSTSLLEFFASFDHAHHVVAADVVIDGLLVDAKHAPVATLVAAGLLDPRTLDGVRIVTTTRNPYDFWAAEWHRTRTRWLSELRFPDSWVHRQPGMIERIVDAVTLDFDEWLDHALGDHDRRGRTTHLNPVHIAEADVVLRMEHLEADLRALLGAAMKRRTVPHANATGHTLAYWQHYGTASRALVARVHAPDLERFGYRF